MKALWPLLFVCGPAMADASLDKYVEGLPVCFDGAKSHEDAAACIGPFSDRCMNEEEGGFTTLGMGACTHAETEVWDRLLNREYKKAMATARALDADEAVYFPGYAVRAEKLRDAQRAWIVFRDAQCAMDYAVWGSGSGRHLAGTSCMLDMTANRTIYLRFLWEEWM